MAVGLARVRERRGEERLRRARKVGDQLCGLNEGLQRNSPRFRRSATRGCEPNLEIPIRLAFEVAHVPPIHDKEGVCKP
jgi:hypothetical protein